MTPHQAFVSLTIGALLFAIGFIVGEFHAARLHEKWGCCHCHCPQEATHIVFTNEEGREVMDITMKVGDQPRRVRAVPRTDDGIEDTTYQDLKHGYDGTEATTAPDGSSSFTADGLILTVSALVPSALDNGNPVASDIVTGLDADAGPGKALIDGHLRVIVLAADDPVIATHVDHEELPPA